jgi:hypothetical protein
MLQLRLLHLIVRRIRQIGTLRRFDGNQFRLPASRIAHLLNGWIRYGVPLHRLALKREPIEFDRVRAGWFTDRQWSQQKCIDQAERRGARPDRQSK